MSRADLDQTIEKHAKAIAVSTDRIPRHWLDDAWSDDSQSKAGAPGLLTGPDGDASYGSACAP